MVDFRRSEQVSSWEAARLAEQAGRPRDAREIRRMLGQLMACRELDRSAAKGMLELRRLKERYLPEQYAGQSLSAYVVSPDSTLRDLRWTFCVGARLESYREVYRMLLSEKGASLCGDDLRYQVPVVFVSGNNDWTTPYPLALEYYRRITAPRKVFLTMEGVGHLPFLERSEEFSCRVQRALEAVCRIPRDQ